LRHSLFNHFLYLFLVKYEQHASQKKRLLAMTQSDSNVTSNSSQMKQEPAEFNASVNYEYPPYDQKRSSWVGGGSSMIQPPNAHQSHHVHNKRDSMGNSGSNQYQATHQPPQQPQQPPIAHGKNDMASSSTTSLNSTPIYHHHNHHYHRTQPQDSPIGTSAALLQPQQADIYAQAEIYRRPTVFVSQASAYAYNARVVPPPAHNPSNRQV
jgi:homeodomain interacting protein kinase